MLTPRSVRWASAGHLPALHLSGVRCKSWRATGLPLGVDESAAYGERELALADGDLVFAYTDGLVEARREGESYGAARLASLVTRLAGSTRPAAAHASGARRGGRLVRRLSDDAVALALRRRPAAHSA